jgi:hypothetical protein
MEINEQMVVDCMFVGRFLFVRLKFFKRSEEKFVSRTITQSGGFNTPPLWGGIGVQGFALGFIPVIGFKRERNNFPALLKVGRI